MEKLPFDSFCFTDTGVSRSLAETEGAMGDAAGGRRAAGGRSVESI